MSKHQNFLLNRLDDATFRKVEPLLHQKQLNQGDVLAGTQTILETVYFPHSGVISLVVELVGGGAIETAMIGKDGQFGGALVLDGKLSLHNVAVQINGTASILRAEHVKIMFAECPDFKKILLSYEQFAFALAQQTAACNATHSVQARACKWLSRMYDLAGEDLYLTQEFLAQMIGVRRTSVSKVAAELQDMNLISYSRGRVRIDNIEHIRKIACECDDAVRDSYGLLFPSDAGHAHL